MQLGDRIRVKDQRGGVIWGEVEAQIKIKASQTLYSDVNHNVWVLVMRQVGEISRYKVKI